MFTSLGTLWSKLAETRHEKHPLGSSAHQPQSVTIHTTCGNTSSPDKQARNRLISLWRLSLVSVLPSESITAPDRGSAAERNPMVSTCCRTGYESEFLAECPFVEADG